ncbi:hypothetical protein OSB04_005451 [Centaurea solstitialis]|uniref:PGG domain-containing protein n=1 Tax=Centaurea solstitialis TaxID=347529 RepID=A0AA38TRL8_9ASTR|nr:hypothetical protein OSB04_005451 [Centaurea solstitialis]
MSQEHEINIPSTSHPRNRPCDDLLCGNKEDYNEICLPLYEASITGDWQAAKILLDKRPELVRFAITKDYNTTLHVAASAEVTKRAEDFLENLVNRMKNEDLELENELGETALVVAAASGSVKMAQIMLNKNYSLLAISGHYEVSPLSVSARHGNHKMARYLYDVCGKMGDALWADERDLVLSQCVADIALEILMDCQESIDDSIFQYVLEELALKANALNTTEGKIYWKHNNPIFAMLHLNMEPSKKDVQALNLLRQILEITIKVPRLNIEDLLKGAPGEDDGYPCKVLFSAAEMGNTRFVIELIRVYPQLIYKVNEDDYTIFHIAIMRRHRGIYNLLYEIGSRKFVLIGKLGKRGNSVLHLLGKTSNKMQLQTMSGASLLMQRELLWFKEVERMLPPYLREFKNKDGQTPYDIFSENNKDFISQGLKWTKDCMIVATLIVTVAFAVAYTVPGGYNQETGIPIFIHKRMFIVFVLADAISLFSSSTSLLVFLSILTSGYSQRDFLYSLPKKLMIGLVSLFISVVAMMITFAASFFVLYRNELKWIPILISIFAAMPAIIFGVLQFPLLIDMFRSMYDSRYLFKPKRRVLYNVNSSW